MKTYSNYPQIATTNAKKAISWKEKYGEEVKAGTQVGWIRAHQLAERESISLDTIKRIARFKRHEKNSAIDPKYRDTPWKDKGYVSYLLWGGKEMISWAENTLEKLEKRAPSKELNKAIDMSAIGIDRGRIEQVREALGDVYNAISTQVLNIVQNNQAQVIDTDNVIDADWYGKFVTKNDLDKEDQMKLKRGLNLFKKRLLKDKNGVPIRDIQSAIKYILKNS